MQYNEIIERLYRLDEDAQLTFSDNTIFKCYIVGGGAFILMGCSIRATHDIDVLSVIPSKLETLFEKYDINTNVKSYIDYFPYAFEERATPIPLNTKRIKYYLLSIEDLIISKLCTTRGEQDILDIRNKSVVEKIDWDILDKLAIDLKSTILSSRRYEEFKYNYDLYIKEFKK